MDYSYLRLPENTKIDFEYEIDYKKKENKKILTLIDSAHDILYTSENIVGTVALEIIMNLFFLKVLQPMLSDKKEPGKIDLLNKEHYSGCEELDDLNTTLSYFKDFNLIFKNSNSLSDIRNNDNKEDDIIKEMGRVLINHPITKQIFQNENFINIKQASTLKSLKENFIDIINLDDFKDNEDIIGEIYEYFLGKYVKSSSKELGQFFTPRKLMKLILKYKEKNIKTLFPEKLEIYDSCMGTGGWLVTSYNIFKQFYKNINIAGGEVVSSTFQYSLMNIMFTLKEFPENCYCNSSLTHVDNKKYNLILTNPPFNSKKKIKFNVMEGNFKKDTLTMQNKIKIEDVYKLKKDDPPIQFLELDIYKLEENGMCIIVLPYGEFFFGSSSQSTREHLMKTVKITDIILVPGGTFTHTGIKTCVLIFEKKNSGTDKINFLQIKNNCSELYKITTVTKEDIENEPVSSWYHTDYLEDLYIKDLSTKYPKFEWVEFGEVFSLVKGTIQSSKVEEDENGDILFITKEEISEKTRMIKNDIYYNSGLFIANAFNGNGKCPIRYTNKKCIHSDLMLNIIINDNYYNKINLKFLYYYLESIKKHIEYIYEKGACQKSLDIKNFNRMKIPIPSIEIQQNIINKLDILQENLKDLNKSIDANKINRNMYMESMIKCAVNKGITKELRLKDVCDFNFGKRITNEENGVFNGEYPVYGGGGISYYTDMYNRDGKTCKISRFGISKNTCILMLNGKYYLNDAGFTVTSKDDNILTNCYLWNYLLLIKHSIYNTKRGSVQDGLGLNLFKIMKIPIPEIKYQIEMDKQLKMFDELDEKIIFIKKNTENNIKNAFFNSLDSYGNPNGFNIENI